METNVVIAIIAGSAVVISAICVLGAGIFTYAANNKRFDKIDDRFDKIDHTLELIQADLKEFFNQMNRIKAHIKLD